MIHFESPLFFLLFLIFPILVWLIFGKKTQNFISFSSVELFKSLPKSFFAKYNYIPNILRIIVLTAIVFALSRPQTGTKQTEIESSGIDIMLAVDVSGSMQAMDFEIDGKRENRLFVNKKVVEEFISKRPSDRIGMVIFGTEAFTQCPLTLDHNALLAFLQEVNIADAGENTAIGSAIATATKRLKDLKSKSKIIILLTDGSNNAGNISPEVAAKAAASLGIKIYTIAVGTQEEVPFPVKDPFTGFQRMMYQRFPVDEEGLKNLANITGGMFFQASETEELRNIYSYIDKLEKTEVKIKEFNNYNEKFAVFLALALLFLGIELFLRETKFKTFP